MYLRNPFSVFNFLKIILKILNLNNKEGKLKVLLMCRFLEGCPELLKSELQERVKASNLSSDLKNAFCTVFESGDNHLGNLPGDI